MGVRGWGPHEREGPWVLRGPPFWPLLRFFLPKAANDVVGRTGGRVGVFAGLGNALILEVLRMSGAEKELARSVQDGYSQ